MTKADRQALGDWLIVIGALALFGSLFLTWSHQFPPGFLVLFGSADLLHGVPHDPTAWQVYSAADVLLALLAAGLVGAALAGSRVVRIVAAGAALIGLAFTIHALSVPPTNGGADIFRADRNVPSYLPSSPGAGAGETVAIVGLVLAVAGLGLTFTAD